MPMAKKESKETDKVEALPPFEQALEQLERIVHDIESGQVTLEQSLEQYERGTKLIRHCRSILDRAEMRIKTLTAGPEGKIEAREEES